MPKIFLAGPATGDSEMTSYLFAAAKLRVKESYPESHIFNPEADLDADPLREAATLSGFDLSDPADRERLIFVEFMECDLVYFLAGWEQDDFCANTIHPLAEQLEMKIEYAKSDSKA